MAKKCMIGKCNNDVFCKNLCGKHHKRLQRHNDPTINKKNKHLMCNTSEYRVFTSIIQRCENKNFKHYKYYGGRGISICCKWRNSFNTFFNDVGPKPFKEAQIDRIDNNGNYEPGNCRWVDRKTNVRNSSATNLTVRDIEEIRELYKLGVFTMTYIGEIFNLSVCGISKIINYKTWE